ncbi:MAG: hypothetical protein IPF96_09650 [Rhodobacter sp.]|nr:hypothetical protein [Rhodobacter sp.]
MPISACFGSCPAGYVALDNTLGLTPEGLAQLADVPELWKLSLRDSEMTDAHMAVVAGLSRVRGLDLTMNAGVTDAAMPDWRRCRR